MRGNILGDIDHFVVGFWAVEDVQEIRWQCGVGIAIQKLDFEFAKIQAELKSVACPDPNGR
jgi:hypothetical protein